MKPLIGMVGVGSMGGPIAVNLLANGYPMLIHDIDSANMNPLLENGAQAVQSAREMASRAETVIICLPTLEAIQEVTLGSSGLRHGASLRTCINFSTSGPRFIKDLADSLDPKRVAMLDCPITGGAAGARAGTLSITASGNKNAFSAAKPLLDCLATHVFYVGAEPGQAQMMKLLNNMLSFAAFVASCEAFALGTKAGLDADAMVDVINTGTGRNSATTHKFPNNILPRTFDYGAKMRISFKDISLFLEEAERLGVPTWLAPMIKQVIGYAISQDGENVDVSTLVKHYEKWCGIEIRGAAAKSRQSPP